MRVTLNGRETEIEDGLNLLELLNHLSIGLKGTAVEVNREIVPKSLYEATGIKEGDRIEIVRMVGGG